MYNVYEALLLTGLINETDSAVEVQAKIDLVLLDGHAEVKLCFRALC